ncbi:hypothetical protein [Pelagovum pacificum]|uniref:Uncharacterized protein n=1 Tax=Pelagovum pacificum TaxID=2588711 RepID=A0A5C5GEE6_9RHOB|nr:hypothetical protein [Pelagovum pacificum]QQA43783.1 hypothetical protein I8N54_04185 [Pelagovum pacificum]TNY33088.1 hypothetical protein FHY64_07350 [Pelagovum pacificum]
MRSIISTSIAGLLCVTAAAAETPAGCYVREYDDVHIKSHPAQTVKWIRIGFDLLPDYSETNAYVIAQFLDRGRAAEDGVGGMTLDQSAICWEYEGTWSCGVECDGGSFDITRIDRDILEIRTGHFSIGDTEGCGGSTTLAEGEYDEPTTYRLYRASDGACRMQ